MDMAELHLDHRSPVPLHAQVEQLLRRLIEQPEYREGALLPDEVSLARRLGVSRSTVRTALTRLVYEGLLERKAGVGTRVAQQPLQSGIGAWHSFTREMEKKGISVQTFSLEVAAVPAEPEVASALQLAPGAPVLRLDRVRGWEDEPVVFFRIWLHPRLGLTPRTDFNRPLYELIEADAGVLAERAHEELTAMAADGDLAKLLGVEAGTPLLRRRRTVYDPGGKPVDYTETHYRSDRFTLTLDIRREGA